MIKATQTSRILLEVVLELYGLLIIKLKCIDRGSHLEWLVVYLQHGIERCRAELVTPTSDHSVVEIQNS